MLQSSRRPVTICCQRWRWVRLFPFFFMTCCTFFFKDSSFRFTVIFNDSSLLNSLLSAHSEWHTLPVFYRVVGKENIVDVVARITNLIKWQNQFVTSFISDSCNGMRDTMKQLLESGVIDGIVIRHDAIRITLIVKYRNDLGRHWRLFAVQIAVIRHPAKIRIRTIRRLQFYQASDVPIKNDLKMMPSFK